MTKSLTILISLELLSWLFCYSVLSKIFLQTPYIRKYDNVISYQKLLKVKVDMST